MNSYIESINHYKLKEVSIASYLIFNFIARDISSFFLITALILCLIDYKNLISNLRYNKDIVIAIFMFTLWMSLIGYYHSTPLREMDNYYRFLLLLPLLSINFRKDNFEFVIILCGFFSIIHFLWNVGSLESRYQGTSNTSITYAYLIVTIILLSANYLFRNIRNIKKVLMHSIICISLIYIWFMTETRGPIIAFFLCIIYLSIFYKNKNLLFIIMLFFVSILFTNDTFRERLLKLSDINIYNANVIDHTSTRERVAYMHYGIDMLSDRPLFGIGPHNIESTMRKNFRDIPKNAQIRDHLHNEYIDISVKFGIPALIFLLLMYIILYIKVSRSDSAVASIIFISLLASQITQSQFAHHQAISFFIVLIYLLMKKEEFTKDDYN